MEKNLHKATKLSAEQGYDDAIFNLGACYFHGNGVEQDLVKGANLFALASSKGNDLAHFWFGFCKKYALGGFDLNVEEAMDLFFRSFEKRNSKFELADCFHYGNGAPKNMEKAISLYTESALMDNPEAQYRLGLLYFKGSDSVEQNYHLAFKWFKAAADLEHVPSIYNLANCYYNSYGIEQNATEAARLYTIAADLGDASAQFNLALQYEAGNGVEKNDEEALRLFRLSSDAGDMCAQFIIGTLYQSGEYGFEQNIHEAIRLFELSAASGYSIAQTALGLLYYKGNNIEKDFIKATKYFKLAVNNRNALAQYALGKCYMKGLGVEANIGKGILLITDAAEQNLAAAQLKLAIYYENEAEDLEKAFLFYNQASRQGYNKATTLLNCFVDKYGDNFQ